MKLATVVFSVLALMATIEAAVLQKCTTTHSAIIVVGVERNTSLLLYPLGDTVKRVGINPWGINDQSLADGSCGLLVCTEHLYAEGKCHDKKIGDIIYTREVQGISPSDSRQIIGENSTYFFSFDAVDCLVLYREGEDKFTDVTIQEHNGWTLSTFYSEEEVVLYSYIIIPSMAVFFFMEIAIFDEDECMNYFNNLKLYLAYGLYAYLKQASRSMPYEFHYEISSSGRDALKIDLDKVSDVAFLIAVFWLALRIVAGTRRTSQFLDHFKFNDNVYVSSVLYLCLLNSLLYIFDPLIQMFCGYTGSYVRPPLNTIVWGLQSLVWIPGALYIAYQGNERLNNDFYNTPEEKYVLRRFNRLICITVVAMYTISYVGQLVEELRWGGNFFVYFASPLFTALRLDELPIDRSRAWWTAVLRQLPKSAPLVFLCPLFEYYACRKAKELYHITWH